jgi:glycine dehydrogenase subunit 1
MSFIPHTDSEREAMLSAIGIARIEELFAGVPDAVRFPALRIPDAVSQMDVETELRALAGANVSPGCKPSFLGAGIYDHYRPATVDSVLRRGELYSSYTPYQPEISQGMLQAMFEFQTMICRLTGMDVCTASHYEGATSLAEAVLLALAATDEKRTRIVMSPAVHPHYRQVVSTYLLGMPATIVGADCGMSGANQYRASVDEITAALVIQSPNFLGQVEDLTAAAAQAHKLGALLIVMTDPISLGLLKPPGAYGADIVVADGQCLGLAPSFGGPSLGIFAARSKFVRRLPGRLVGETTDGAGRRGYVLTLGTREQHIRRAKATSNICTNSALSALAASVYLATLGRHGLRRVAELCFHRSHYAAEAAASLPGVTLNPQAPDRPYFKEFVLRLPRPVPEVNNVLFEQFDLIGGLDLGTLDERLANHMLLAVTERRSRAEIDRLVDGLREATL